MHLRDSSFTSIQTTLASTILALVVDEKSEEMDSDVLIIGGGLAGLAAAHTLA